MPIPLTELQSRVGDLDRWAPHVNEPFSAESLSDPDKPYVVINNLPFPDSMCAYDTQGKDWAVDEPYAKAIGHSDITVTCLSNICSQRARTGNCYETSRMRDHLSDFQLAARHILGQTKYTQSLIDLTLWSEAVEIGTGQVPIWHLDIHGEEDDRNLLGLGSDTLPTQILLNPTRPSDYERGILKSIMGVPINQISEEQLAIKTLSADTLTVLPMSIPHRGQIAGTYIAQRHFLRLWTSDPKY